MTEHAIILIDPSRQRRDAIKAEMFRSGVSIEPRSCVRDLPAPSRCGGIFLVADDGDMVENLMDHLGNSRRPCAVVAMAETPELPSVVKAIKAGVLDYLSLPLKKSDLFSAITAAKNLVESSDTGEHSEARARELVRNLTKRESEVIHAVSLGWTSREIGASLGISPRTVEIHRGNALKKLRARNSSEAVRVLHDASRVAI